LDPIKTLNLVDELEKCLATPTFDYVMCHARITPASIAFSSHSLNKPSSLMPPHHMKENVAPHANAVIHSDDSKPQTKARARWNAPCDSILLNTLAGVKAQGRQTDNAGWHSDAYTLFAEKLEGPEMKSEGPKKTGKMCLTGWTAVCFVFNKFMMA
jgi:hypothetical protein